MTKLKKLMNFAIWKTWNKRGTQKNRIGNHSLQYAKNIQRKTRLKMLKLNVKTAMFIGFQKVELRQVTNKGVTNKCLRIFWLDKITNQHLWEIIEEPIEKNNGRLATLLENHSEILNFKP